MKNYYALVAGMPDLSPDDAKLNFTVADFKEDYYPRLSGKDQRLVALFFLQYDHRNLLARLAEGEGAAFDDRGMFGRDDLAEALEKGPRMSSPRPTIVMPVRPGTRSCAIGSPSTGT